MNEFVFRYDSYGLGSATVTLSDGNQDVIFDASYIGRNPLGDLLEAVAEMFCNNQDHCKLHWISEPGILRLNIKKKNGEAHILVEEYDEDIDYRKVGDDQWGTKLDAVMTVKRLADAVVSEAERNLRLHGLVGFSEDWCDHVDVFPISAYLRLKGIVSRFGDNDLRTSSLEEELAMLRGILKQDE